MTTHSVDPLISQGTSVTRFAPVESETLFADLYIELCRLARCEVWRYGAHGVLGTTTLVHEAWLDIQRSSPLEFEEAGRFLAYATRMMRGLIIDKVRARHAQKRGGGMIITSLSAENADYVLQPDSLEGVSEALDHLATVEPELAVVVDLKFFCGFTFGEIAEMHGISARTVQRQWEKARILLLSILST